MNSRRNDDVERGEELCSETINTDLLYFPPIQRIHTHLDPEYKNWPPDMINIKGRLIIRNQGELILICRKKYENLCVKNSDNQRKNKSAPLHLSDTFS